MDRGAWEGTRIEGLTIESQLELCGRRYRVQMAQDSH